MRIFKQGLILLAGLLMISSVWAGSVEEASEVVEVEGAEKIDVRIDFGTGELDIEPSDMENAARLDISYEPQKVRYDLDYSRRGKTGYLHFESELRHHVSHRHVENDCDLLLSRRYPTALELDLGACDAKIELGGIPLSALSVDAGATSAVIGFSERNPTRLEDIDIEVGAASLEMTGLGNANAEHMEFSVGAASCDLNFSGDFHGETEVEIDVGIGSVDVTVPRDLALRIEGDNSWFSSVDFHRLDLNEVDDDVWETRNFDDAKDRLIIVIEVGMGSIDIYGK